MNVINRSRSPSTTSTSFALQGGDALEQLRDHLDGEDFTTSRVWTDWETVRILPVDFEVTVYSLFTIPTLALLLAMGAGGRQLAVAYRLESEKARALSRR